MTTRRSFLGAMLAACAAPAIVRADSLMRVIPVETEILLPEPTPRLDIVTQAEPDGITTRDGSRLTISGNHRLMPGDVISIAGVVGAAGAQLFRITAVGRGTELVIAQHEAPKVVRAPAAPWFRQFDNRKGKR